MKVAELKNEKTEYQAKVTFSNNEISDLIEKELATVAKTAKMDGFRVGKVPSSVLKKKYSNSIRMDIAKKKVDDSINKIIEDNKLNIAGDPSIDDLVMEENKDLEFTVKFDLLPKIEMPDFKKISIEKPVLKVSEKDITEQLDMFASHSKSYDKETKAKAKKGDQVTIDAIGYVDGKAFDGGKLDAHKLVLGSNSFIPGFEDQLVGSKAGEDVSVKVDFPKEYHAKELAGKPSEFKVQVKAVHKETPVSIDDDFAKKFKCETLEELKEKINTNIQASYEEPIHTTMKMSLFDALNDLLKFDVPSSLLKKEKESLKNQTEQMGYEDPSIKDKSEEEKEAYFDTLAGRRVKIGLMLAEYVSLNSLKIVEEDIREAIMAQARNYPGQEKEVFEFYKNDRNALESLKGPVLEEKAVKEIFAKEVKIKEKEYSKDKIEKLFSQD